MHHSQRLRQLADRTGLDGFAEELRAMADEIETQTPEMPELPRPDTHCFDDDTGKDVWSYSADQMRSYAILALHTQPTNGADVLDALEAGKHYAKEALSRHVEAYGRHPSTEPEHTAILVDIAAIDAAINKAIEAAHGIKENP